MSTIAVLEKYAGNLAGVGMYALDQWRYWRDDDGPKGEYDWGFRAGKMKAYSEILQLVTGRNVGTEEKLVKEIIESIKPS